MTDAAARTPSSLADTPPFDRFPAPACARTLGWRLIDQDAARGWVKVGFEGAPEFLNPAGFVQGGLLAAMLDDVMGPAALVMTHGRLYTVTITMSLTYLAPARAGPLIGEGQVVSLGKTIAALEGRLFAADGREVARAVSSARLVPTERAVG